MTGPSRSSPSVIHSNVVSPWHPRLGGAPDKAACRLPQFRGFAAILAQGGNHAFEPCRRRRQQIRQDFSAKHGLAGLFGAHEHPDQLRLRSQIGIELTSELQLLQGSGVLPLHEPQLRQRQTMGSRQRLGTDRGVDPFYFLGQTIGNERSHITNPVD
ncbi:MAG: hypothetical protein LBL48_08390 [Azoarcus sp.]|nr:hypothetical protein [Azoarcus sp.]